MECAASKRESVGLTAVKPTAAMEPDMPEIDLTAVPVHIARAIRLPSMLYPLT